jgi:hypothetical protein
MLTQQDGNEGKRRTRFVTIPSAAIDAARKHRLSGNQYELWLYLCQLDPYGKWIEIPSPAELALIMGCNARTIERSARRLQDCGLFEFEIKTWKAQNLQPHVNQNPLGKEIHLSANGSKCPTNRSKNGHFDPKNGSLCPENENETALGGDFSDRECTNNRSKDHLKQENSSNVPAAHPVLGEDRDNLGTGDHPLTADVARLSTIIRGENINPNRTIQETITALIFAEGPAAATKSVENALSALREQQEQGVVRNPGGFINSALRRRFTGNGAKKQARAKRSAAAPPPAPMDLSDTIALIDVQCSRLGISRAEAVADEGYRCSFGQLSDDQLMSLARRLESLSQRLSR